MQKKHCQDGIYFLYTFVLIIAKVSPAKGDLNIMMVRNDLALDEDPFPTATLELNRGKGWGYC